MADVAQRQADDFRRHPLFLRSLNPMLIADDERRYVDANAAACLFLRLPLEEIRRLRIDDLAPAELRAGIDAMWSEFLHGRLSQAGRTVPWDLQMPDGAVVQVDLSSVPCIWPGHHLGIILFPASRDLNERLDHAKPPTSDVLTKREREILTLVALGNTGVQIAEQLYLSPATVATHVTKALIKLGAKNRAHGIAIALHADELDLADAAPALHPFVESQMRSHEREQR